MLACWMIHGVVAARPQAPSLDSESRGWGGSLAEPVHPWPTGSEGEQAPVSCYNVLGGWSISLGCCTGEAFGHTLS